MVIAQIFFEESHESILRKYEKEWNLPKYEVVRRIIIEFDELKREVTSRKSKKKGGSENVWKEKEKERS